MLVRRDWLSKKKNSMQTIGSKPGKVWWLQKAAKMRTSPTFSSIEIWSCMCEQTRGAVSCVPHVQGLTWQPQSASSIAKQRLQLSVTATSLEAIERNRCMHMPMQCDESHRSDFGTFLSYFLVHYDEAWYIVFSQK